jgi:LysM repeat protein
LATISSNVIVAVFFFALPLVASAGILSYIASFFSPARASGEVEHNLQTMALLQSALNFDPSPSSGGGDITIVSGTALLSENDPLGGLAENQKDHPSSDQISVYVVRPGDTLGTIAKMFGVSINTIRWNNDISGSTISPGQTLIILPVSGVRHTVKKGDTLKGIAKLYKGDIEEIKKYNNIDEKTVLAIGDVVIVPDGEIVSSGTGSSQVRFITSDKVYSGYYIRPTTGPKSQGLHGNNGVDIAPPTGTPIVAAADGTVIISRNSGWNGGYGNYVVIQHPNGTQTLYSHMKSTGISQGSRVTQGQVIGYVGATGKVTGPHLHFEVRGARNPF